LGGSIDLSFNFLPAYRGRSNVKCLAQCLASQASGPAIQASQPNVGWGPLLLSQAQNMLVICSGKNNNNNNNNNNKEMWFVDLQMTCQTLFSYQVLFPIWMSLWCIPYI